MRHTRVALGQIINVIVRALLRILHCIRKFDAHRLANRGLQDCLKTVIEENPVMKDDAFIAQANAECSSAFYYGMAHTHLPEPHVLQKPYL